MKLGNTERRVKNLMSKMSGGDLGKLFMKDVIGELGGESRAYSPEDFDAVLSCSVDCDPSSLLRSGYAKDRDESVFWEVQYG